MATLFIVILFFIPLHIAKAQHRLDTSIRTVKWDSLLAHDKAHFLIDSETSRVWSELNLGPNYRLTQDKDEGGFYGNPYYATKYFDLNRDGKEDAIISLSNPGSGAFATAVIFLQTPNGPKYVGYAGGPHFEDSIYGDTLSIVTAHPLEMDPQCCNRAVDVQRLVGDGDTLRWLPLMVKPQEGGGWQTVYDFYSALNDTDKHFAYSMLSETYRVQHPYSMWLKGFATTISVDADVDKDSPDTAVRVKIMSKDKIRGKIVTKHFSGIWHTQFSTNNRGTDDPTDETDWFLDRPEILEVK